MRGGGGGTASGSGSFLSGLFSRGGWLHRNRNLVGGLIQGIGTGLAAEAQADALRERDEQRRQNYLTGFDGIYMPGPQRQTTDHGQTADQRALHAPGGSAFAPNPMDPKAMGPKAMDTTPVNGALIGADPAGGTPQPGRQGLAPRHSAYRTAPAPADAPPSPATYGAAPHGNAGQGVWVTDPATGRPVWQRAAAGPQPLCL